MTRRETVIDAIHHLATRAVPYHLDLTDEVRDRLERERDMFGVVWRKDEVGDFGVVERVILDRIVDYNLAVMDIAMEYPIDSIFFGDDWGSQRGLIMGLELVKLRLRVPCLPRGVSTEMILEKELVLVGSLGRTRRVALFDSGSSSSIIRRDIAETAGHLEPLPNPSDWVFETAEAGRYVEARCAVRFDIRFDDSQARFGDEFIVFDECSEEAIIGTQTMQKWQIKLDFEYETVSYRKTAIRLRV